MKERHHLRIIDGGSPELAWKFHPNAMIEVSETCQFEKGMKGDLLAVMRRLASRTARDAEVEHPLQSHPEVGELRFDRGERRYRLFFATPDALPLIIIALKFWRKSGDDEQINDLQNAAIHEAGVRLEEWLKNQ